MFTGSHIAFCRNRCWIILIAAVGMSVRLDDLARDTASIWCILRLMLGCLVGFGSVGIAQSDIMKSSRLN
jgi:hypothetical protein